MRLEDQVSRADREKAVSAGIALVRDSLIALQREFGTAPFIGSHGSFGLTHRRLVERMTSKVALYDAMQKDFVLNREYCKALKFRTARLHMRAASIEMRETGTWRFPE